MYSTYSETASVLEETPQAVNCFPSQEVSNMSQLAFGKAPQYPDAGCAELSSMAERELTAFRGAVTELFGAEQAELSTEEWLKELQALDRLPASRREWRSLTARASSVLASRVNSLTAIQ